jgi:membrane dipeptidase
MLVNFIRIVSIVAVLVMLAYANTASAQGPATDPRGPVVLTDEGRRVHATCIVIDGHNDLPNRMRDRADSSFDKKDIAESQPDLHTDIARLRTGGLGAQFWAAYVPSEYDKQGGSARFALEQIDLIRRMVDRYPDTFELALTADDIERIHADGRFASMIGIEGGHAIEESLGALRMFYTLGVRYMTLTHADSLSWCDSATDEPISGGLSPFGEEVVLEMNRLGMLVDISHISADAMRHVLRVSKAPVIASHSGAYTIAEHERNVPDDVLESVRDNGGVVMVNFFSGYVEPTAAKMMGEMFQVERELHAQYPDKAEYEEAKKAWRKANPYPSGSVHDVIDHIDHIVKVAGIDHVGLGSDYDGVNKLPTQLEDVTGYPYITQALLDRGYSAEDVRKVMGGNLLRAMRGAELIAKGGS